MTAARRWSRDRRTNAAAESRAREAIGPRQLESSEIERNELAEVLQQEISRLPEKYRAPIVLCHMQGLTHDEAAAALSWPVGTVRSRLSRGRNALRRGWKPAACLPWPRSGRFWTGQRLTAP